MSCSAIKKALLPASLLNPGSRVRRGKIPVQMRPRTALPSLPATVPAHTHTQVRPEEALCAVMCAFRSSCSDLPAANAHGPLLSPPTAAGAPSKRLPGTPTAQLVHRYAAALFSGRWWIGDLRSLLPRRSLLRGSAWSHVAHPCMWHPLWPQCRALRASRGWGPDTPASWQPAAAATHLHCCL